MKKTGIYKITNLVNGRFYVGQSIDMVKRFRQHVYRLELGQSPSPRLMNAWRKYGKEAFTFEILEEVGKENLDAREQHWIDLLDACGPNGYNCLKLAKGARRGVPLSDEHRAKVSAAVKAAHARRSPERKAEIAAALSAALTPEKRAALSEKTRLQFSNEGAREAQSARSLANADRVKETKERNGHVNPMQRPGAKNPMSDPAARAKLAEKIRANHANGVYQK